MSAIEYNNLLFEISQRLEELNVLDRLLFMCRGKLASRSEDNIRDVLSLFKELEEQNNLGTDRLEVIKGLLKSFKEWSFFGRVKEFERKRKKYNGLLEQIIVALDELNELERLIGMCRGNISQESEGQIRDVRALFNELENQNNLEYDRLDILKEVLIETEKSDLLRELEEFEDRRNQEDEFERRKAQAVAVASSIGNTLIGVLNIKTVFKVVAGGITVVSTMEVLSRWSTFDQLVTAVNTCVLPAGTSLVNLTDGCVCLTVQAETLSALTTLWNLYQDGTLERRLYNFFVTDEVKERAGEETVEVNVTIEEEEYDKARLDLMNEAQETARIDIRERLRRNSDSAVFFRPKEETPVLKIMNERIAWLERKIQQLHPEILEDCSPEEKATKFSRQQESWKALEAGEKDEGTEELEISQRHKPKLMDPGKLAFVQEYLEDVQDTRSMTTNVSDSGLATHTAASEIGTEEVNESSKLCLKDLSDDVILELSRRLQSDKAVMGNFCQFFGLKVGNWYLFEDRFSFIEEIKKLFPDTTVSVLKEGFEALWLYDLAELLDKVRPRSLRPAVSPEQIEKLRRADDRPTKYHSDVAVLVVDFTVEGDVFEREDVRKIETSFKDLNSRNEVAIISSSLETRKVVREMNEINFRLMSYETEDSLRKRLEGTLQQKALLEQNLEEVMQMEKWNRKSQRRGELEVQLTRLKQWELTLRGELENIAETKKQAERDTEKLEELKKEITKPISTALNEWMHNQDKCTCVVVLIRNDYDKLCTEVLERLVLEKLALIPDHTKVVVTPYAGWESIAEFPETLHVVYNNHEGVPVVTRMIEIFNKRWQTLDVISMMQELKRGTGPTVKHFGFGYWNPHISIKVDSLSSLPKFQKKEDEHSP